MTYTCNSSSFIFTIIYTLAALEDAVARCPSLTPQSVSQGVGIGYMIGFEDKAACNMDRLRYQLKKAKGPKVDSNTVITQFEDIANEVDQADEKGSSALSGGLKPHKKTSGVWKYPILEWQVLKKELSTSL